MRTCLFLLLLCLFTAGTVAGSAIDSLETNDDVVRFLDAHLPGLGGSGDYSFVFRTGDTAALLPAPDDTTLADRLADDTGLLQQLAARPSRSNRFYKVDIDGNGRTDLVIDGTALLVVMDMEDGIKELFIDGNWWASYAYMGITHVPGSSTGILLLHYYKDSTGLVATVDTEVFKYGGLVEYNPSFTKSDVQKIVLSKNTATDMVAATGDFCIMVDAKGYSIMHKDAGHAANNIAGDSCYTLDSVLAGNLMNFAAYADLRGKKDSYVRQVDHSTGIDVTISYNDGTVKHIHTWSMIASIGLESLAVWLGDICHTLPWKPLDNCMFCPCR